MSFDVWLKKRRSLFLRERLKRENANIEQGMIIIGYHPKPMSWRKAKRRAQHGRMTMFHRLPGGRVHNSLTCNYHSELQQLAGYV